MDIAERIVLERQEDYQQEKFDSLFEEMKRRAPRALSKLVKEVLGEGVSRFTYDQLTDVQKQSLISQLQDMKLRHDLNDAEPEKEPVFRR